MTFANDRDLLMLEPRVFNDAVFLTQQRLHVADVVLDGTMLTSDAADFLAAQVAAGSVALLGPDALPIEVIDRIDLHKLSVSLLRRRLTDVPIPPGDRVAVELIVRTFGPQMTLVHDALLARMGLDDDEPIVSMNVMAQLEALGTLERIYTAAVTLDGEHPALLQKAEHYRSRFIAALERAIVLLDLDADGVADAKRRFSDGQLRRV